MPSASMKASCICARAILLIALAAIAYLPVGNRTALAQEKFPSQSIELIVTFGPGGGADGMARTLAPILEPIVGYPVLVSNVAGGSGNVGLTKLLTNPPDGYTVATLSAATVAAWALGVGYAKIDDFTMLAVTRASASMMFVASASPFNSFNELLDYAAANPGKLRVATSGVGTHHEIVLNYFASRGYVMQNMPFAMREAAYQSLLNKRSDVLYEEPGDVREYLESKKYRPLLVFDRQRHPAFAGVPTASEFGLELSDLTSFTMLVVPAKTPADRVQFLAQAIDKALASPEWRKYCEARYICVAPHTPDEAKAKAKNFYEIVSSHAKPPR